VHVLNKLAQVNFIILVMPDPCAHIGFSFFIAHVFSNLLPSQHQLTLPGQLVLDTTLAVSALLPDLIDKPLFILKITKGTRTWGHTLLNLIICVLLTWWSLENVAVNSFFTSWLDDELASSGLKMKVLINPIEWATAVFLGISSHLLADWYR